MTAFSFPIYGCSLVSNYIIELNKRVSDLNNSKNRKARLILTIIFVAIQFASDNFNKSDFLYLLKSKCGILPRSSNKNHDIKFHNPFNKNDVIILKNVQLIKHMKLFQNEPIFELRINAVNDINIGLRCIFFVMMSKGYQCYVSVFTKPKPRNYRDANWLCGHRKTDAGIILTHVALCLQKHSRNMLGIKLL